MVCVACVAGLSDYNANGEQIGHPDLCVVNWHLEGSIGCRTQASGSPAEKRSWFWFKLQNSMYGLALHAYAHLSSVP